MYVLSQSKKQNTDKGDRARVHMGDIVMQQNAKRGFLRQSQSGRQKRGVRHR